MKARPRNAAFELAATERKTMIDDVYNAKILGFAGNIGRIGRLADPGRDGDRAFEAVRLDGDRSTSRCATASSPISRMR